MAMARNAAALGAAVGAAVVVGCGDDGAATERAAQVAFTANQGGRVAVVVAAADGRHRARLADGASSPAWSPDGGSLAFVRERDDDSDIAIMEADGSAARPVTSGAGRDRDPAFSSDGQWIAFTREQHPAEGPVRAAIYLVRRDGSGLRRVTAEGDLVGQPAWSPDGRQLAFTRATARGRWLVAHLYVAEAVEGGGASWSRGMRRRGRLTGAGSHTSRGRIASGGPASTTAFRAERSMSSAQTAAATDDSRARWPTTTIPPGRPPAARSCSRVTAPTEGATTASCTR